MRIGRTTMTTNDLDSYCAFDQFCIVVAETFAQDSKPGFVFFDVEQDVEYVGFAQDFGPFNLASVHTFCGIVETMRKLHPTEVLALQCRPDPRSVTNTVFRREGEREGGTRAHTLLRARTLFTYTCIRTMCEGTR